MLPLNSSSIQKRRLLHRRQQSLEVPILATPLPPNSRRTQPGRTGHRRGLSLDQSLSALSSSTGFRPLLPQDTNHPGPPSGPLARTRPDTNSGQRRQIPPEKQHFIKQETQKHSLAQPGFTAPPQPQQAHDFQSHLHQQLNGIINPSTASPNPGQAAAMQQLQDHMAWYQKTYGSVDPSIQTPQYGPSTLADGVDTAIFPIGQPMVFGVSQQSQTVPNTPQDYSAGWPSPPQAQMKQTRSQSYQLDVATMPQGMTISAMAGQSASFHSDGSFGSHGDHDYAASNYSSSVADPSSPPQQHSTPMPTLFEESSTSLDEPIAGDLLLQAAAGAETDFNSPSFFIGGNTVCTEQAALDAAGIDATYIENGITEENINSFLVSPTKKGDAYVCTYQGCGAKVNRKENARAHVQNHLDDRKYQCNVCEKRFTRSHDTKRHAMTHTDHRPAMCPCGRRFARADALTRHRQRDMCVGVLPGYEKDPEDKPKRGRPKKDRSGQDSGLNKKKATRPDMDTRTHKAALARAMDRACMVRTRIAASASSALSERSFPDTPPHDADSMDAQHLLGLNGEESEFNNVTSPWIDTPPTSPPPCSPSRATTSKTAIDLSQDRCVSPSKLSTRSSPPAMTGSHGHVFPLKDYASPVPCQRSDGFHGGSSPVDPTVDIFSDSVNFDVMDSHPDVGQDVFSPPGESCSNSSVYNSDFDSMQVSHVKAKPSLPTIYDERRVSGRYGLDDPFSDGLDDFTVSSPSDQFSEFRDMLDSWLLQN